MSKGKWKKKESIISPLKRKCYMCGSMRNLETHHVMYGTANRRLSDRYGLTVTLCHYCHNEPPNGVHFNKENDLKLKRLAQISFQNEYPDKDFVEIFGENYLEDFE